MSIIISNISNLVLFIVFCRMTLGAWEKKAIYIIPIIIIQILKICFSVDFTPIVNLSFAILLNFFVLLLFKGKISKKILLLFIYMCFSIVSEEFALLITESIITKDISLNSSGFYILNLISKLILLVFIVVSSIILYTVKNENIKWKDTLIILTFPLATMFYIVVSRYPIYYNDVNISFFVTVILFIIATIANCYELFRILRNNQIQAELSLLKEKQKSDHEYYDLLLKKSERERQIMHDINKHDQYLSVLLSEKNYDEAVEYLNQRIDAHTGKRVIVTKNKTLDLILETLTDKIIDNNISIDTTNVTSVDLSRVKEIDQCTIFANILENAIESCTRSIGNEIILTLKQDKSNRIIFKTENSCDKVNQINANEFATLKENDFHGIGLKNVKECLEKYHGMLTTTFNNNMFTTIIVLNLVD